MDFHLNKTKNQTKHSQVLKFNFKLKNVMTKDELNQKQLKPNKI